MERVHLTEAFKKLNILNEEDFNLYDNNDLEKMRQFDDESVEEFISVIDPEAEWEEDLKDSYIGNVIIDCEVCHSKIFKAPEDIVVDEASELVNVGEECPYCTSTDGYKIIGQVAPYETIEVDVDGEDVDEVEETEVVEESLEEGKDCDKKPCPECEKEMEEGCDKDLKECDKPLDEAKPSTTLKKFMKNNRTKLKREDLEKEEESLTDAEVLSRIREKVRHSTSKIRAWVDDKLALKDYHEYINQGLSSEAAIKKVADAITLQESKKLISTLKSKLDESVANNLKFRVTSSGKIISARYNEQLIPVSLKVQNMSSLLECLSTNFNIHTLTEDFKTINVDGDQQDITIEQNPNGGVTVNTRPKDANPSGDEMIEPLEPEIEDEIMAAQDEPSFDEEPVEDTIDYDVDDFDEASFNELGESYLKNVYENVNSFKTSKVSTKGNKLVVEGVIKFNSGKSKNTKFIFESHSANKNGKVTFKGLNEQMSRGKKSFTLTGNIKGKSFISESLTYNYRAKNSKGKSTRVYGTVKK